MSDEAVQAAPAAAPVAAEPVPAAPVVSESHTLLDKIEAEAEKLEAEVCAKFKAIVAELKSKL